MGCASGKSRLQQALEVKGQFESTLAQALPGVSKRGKITALKEDKITHGGIVFEE